MLARRRTGGRRGILPLGAFEFVNSNFTAHTMSKTNEMDRLLGKFSDGEVARRCGVLKRQVRTRRMQLGIDPYRTSATRFRWTNARDRLLGTMPDTEVSEKLGATLPAIRFRRQQLGVAAYVPEQPVSGGPRADPYPWTAAEDDLLGTMHDTELAEQLGVWHSIVTYRRMQLDKEAFRPSQRVEWTRGMQDLLGEVPDAVVARDYEISPTTVKLKRLELGIPPYGKQYELEPELPLDVINRIGKVADLHLATVYGVSRLRIRVYRKLHNIPAVKADRPTKFSWGKKEDRLLGTMSDRRLALRLGIAPPQVRYRRSRLGVPPCGRTSAIRWTQKRVEQLGKASDVALARTWNCMVAAVREKRDALGIRAVKTPVRKWTRQELRSLGTIPDSQLARQLGISPTAVRNKRTEQSIKPWKPRTKERRWKKSELRLLGQLPDGEVAHRLGISDSCVQQKRRELNIPTAQAHRGVWSNPSALAKLGNMSDGQLARQLDVTPSAVRCKRLGMGIVAFKPSTKSGKRSRGKRA